MNSESPEGPHERMVGRHTPGPWKWRQGVGEWELVGADHNRVLYQWQDAAGLSNATVIGYSLKPTDAQLIAAAPELLEALDALVSACELPGDHCEIAQALPGAIAAIGKALGVTPNVEVTGGNT